MHMKINVFLQNMNILYIFLSTSFCLIFSDSELVLDPVHILGSVDSMTNPVLITLPSTSTLVAPQLILIFSISSKILKCLLN